MQCMRDHSIEFRRGSVGGSNQLRQPYLRSLLGDIFIDFPETEHIDYYGFYIGNFPSLGEDDVLTLCAILNSVK
jgi:CDP-4-dehydro-6-deoxyglucose reductase, E1